jgi:type IV secretory pathway TrbD component
MGKWLKENLTLYGKVVKNELPIVAAAQFVGIFSSIITFLIFGINIWVIFSFYLGEFLVILPFTWIKRNDPNYYPYYIFHLSHISLAIIFLAVPFIVALYLHAQCWAYSMGVGWTCINKILRGF